MLRSLSVAVLMIGAAPAFAEINQNSAETKAKDPNRIICERYEETGSRLATKKVCRTAQQWEEQRREQRDSVERIQQGVNQRPGG